jgi:GGDEF domain-containing protein
MAELADRVIAAVSRPVELDGGTTVSVGISVGVAVVDETFDGLDADRLLILADTAMYRAKAHGGNGYRLVTASE